MELLLILIIQIYPGNWKRKMAELGEAGEAELQRLVAAEQQKAQFTAQVRG